MYTAAARAYEAGLRRLPEEPEQRPRHLPGLRAPVDRALLSCTWPHRVILEVHHRSYPPDHGPAAPPSAWTGVGLVPRTPVAGSSGSRRQIGHHNSLRTS